LSAGILKCGSDGHDGACALTSVNNLLDGPSGGGQVLQVNKTSAGHGLSFEVFTTIMVFFTPT
jgi:hypothetical protein